MRIERSSTGLGILALLALFFLAGCGDGETESGAGQATTAPTTVNENEADDEPDGGSPEETAQPDDPGAGDGSDPGDDGGDGDGDGSGEELFPDVIGATASQDGDGSWTFSATLSSPYDTPERYADAWRVLGPDGEVYGIRELTHDHASEQPFTRQQSGIIIPDGVTTVTVEGRDQVSGWGGAIVEVELGS